MNILAFNYRGVNHSEGRLVQAWDLVEDGECKAKVLTHHAPRKKKETGRERGRGRGRARVDTGSVHAYILADMLVPTLAPSSLHSPGRLCLDHLVDTLGALPENVILFGHSIGGAVAAQLRADHSPHGPLVVDRSFSSLVS